MLNGERPKLYGQGQHVRDWIHVNDHSAAVMAVLNHGTIGETYLIGADGQRSNLEVVQLALEILGRPVDDFDLVPDRPGHDVRYAIDASKLRTQLGWTPQFSDFESGLVATIDWYRGNEAWWRPQKTATEERYRRRA